MVLRWRGGGARQSACSCLFLPSNAVCLGLCGAESGLHPHLLVQRFSQWCLVLEQLLVVLLARESNVRKNLCRHLADVTRSLVSFNYGSLGGLAFQEAGGVLFH